MKHISIQDVRAQEISVESETQQRLSGFLEYFDRFANILIELLYATPPVSAVIEDLDKFKYQARLWLYSSVFTFRASVLLLCRGYYLESQILDRNLIEVLAKLRYFYKHPSEFEGFQSLAAKKKPTITWKKMFDEVLPGYYEDEYSWSLSYAAHGGVGANIYRMAKDSAGNWAPDAGISFKEFWSGAGINQKTVFMLGYLRTYREIFPEGVSLLSIEGAPDLLELERLLEAAIKAHISNFGPNEWHKAVEPIWQA